MIEFELIEKENAEAFETIVKWDNDEQIKYFIRPNFNEGEIEQVCAIDLYQNYKSAQTRYTFFIIYKGEEVGYVSLDCQFPMLLGEKESSGWLSICVGEAHVRHLGIGSQAILFIENYARSIGLKRLELGVFDYNGIAIGFYEKIGYQKIGEISNFVYYKGQYHGDIRMEKSL